MDMKGLQMSDIKVGDKVAIYANFYGVLRRAVCIVTKTCKLGFLVKFCDTDKDGFVTLLDEITNQTKLSFPAENYQNFWFHRKQCRRLVKVRKCDECKGVGTWMIAVPEDSKFSGYANYKGPMNAEEFNCPKCSGKGKIKV